MNHSVFRIRVFCFLAFLALPFLAFAASSASSFRTLQSANIGAPECSDGIDNDGDLLNDFPTDPGCTSVNDTSELNTTQCSDGIDNDGDSLIDYPLDPGCANASDNDETNVVGGGGGGDTTPPSINTLAPADNATDVSTTTTLTVDFNEPIIAQSGNIKVKKTSDNSTVQTISVSSAQAVISPSTRLTVTLSLPLLPGTGYYAELESGIVSDGAGNTFGGLSGASSWNFTTAGDATPPQISSVVATPETTLADLSWVTDEPALSSFFWGTTTDYATGSGTEVTYSQNHATTFSGLVSNTLYFYKIEARDALGNIGTVTGSFTTLAASDTTPPANPSGFAAVAGTDAISLSWTNPSDPDFDGVKVMRSTAGYPASPTDGTLVYQGSGESALDAGVTLDVRYYYTIFARDTSLNYSSGAIASALIPSVPPIVPSPPTEPPTPSGGGGETTPSPIITPPIISPPPQVRTSTPPLLPPPAAPVLALAFSDFDFFEQQEKGEKKAVSKDNQVSIVANNGLRISINAEKVSGSARIFIFSVTDQATGKTSAYLFGKNKQNTAFETTIAPLPSGRYPSRITIYDEQNRLLYDVKGFILSSSFSSPLLSRIPAIITEKITPVIENAVPVAAPVGVAVGVAQAAVLAANINSLYDLYLLFLKFIGLFTGLFRKKKPEPWGVVYDAVTKQPIDPAYVVVTRLGGRETKSSITDLDGRYGFLLEPGNYSLAANKTHYKFPSDKLIGKTHDELYDNLYFGSPFELPENQIVRYNIPLDPLEFDWNEFAKNKNKIFSLYSRRQRLRVWLFNSLFYIGLGISIYGTILNPTKLNGALLAVYGAIIIFQSVWRYRHRVTNLIEGKTGNALPFALITVTIPGLGVLVKKVVTDQLGRFYLLVAPGIYDIVVEEKQLDGGYAVAGRFSNVSLKKGVLTKNLVV